MCETNCAMPSFARGIRKPFISRTKTPLTYIIMGNKDRKADGQTVREKGKADGLRWTVG
jgi:hypothetical protein